MSHHRQTITATGAPEAVGPYTHAVVSNGLVFCSGQVPLDPETGKLVEGSIGDQTRRCLENLSVVAAAAGAQLSDAVRMGIYVTDMEGSNAGATATLFSFYEGAGTTPIYARFLAANGGGFVTNLNTPWKLPAATALNYRNSAASSVHCTVNYYIAP